MLQMFSICFWRRVWSAFATAHLGIELLLHRVRTRHGQHGRLHVARTLFDARRGGRGVWRHMPNEVNSNRREQELDVVGSWFHRFPKEEKSEKMSLTLDSNFSLLSLGEHPFA